MAWVKITWGFCLLDIPSMNMPESQGPWLIVPLNSTLPYSFPHPTSVLNQQVVAWLTSWVLLLIRQDCLRMVLTYWSLATFVDVGHRKGLGFWAKTAHCPEPLSVFRRVGRIRAMPPPIYSTPGVATGVLPCFPHSYHPGCPPLPHSWFSGQSWRKGRAPIFLSGLPKGR